jgi:hypothetical protein
LAYLFACGYAQLVPKYSWDIPGCLVAVQTLGQWNAALNCEGCQRSLSGCMGDVLLAISLGCHALCWAQVPGMQRMQDRDTAGFGWPPFYAYWRPRFLVPLQKSKWKAASSPPHAVLQPLLVLSLVNIIQAGNVIPAWPPCQFVHCNAMVVCC